MFVGAPPALGLPPAPSGPPFAIFGHDLQVGADPACSRTPFAGGCARLLNSEKENHK